MISQRTVGENIETTLLTKESSTYVHGAYTY